MIRLHLMQEDREVTTDIKVSEKWKLIRVTKRKGSKRSVLSVSVVHYQGASDVVKMTCLIHKICHLQITKLE